MVSLLKGRVRPQTCGQSHVGDHGAAPIPPVGRDGELEAVGGHPAEAFQQHPGVTWVHRHHFTTNTSG